MSFQDHSEIPVHIPRQPSVVERWLRKIFVEDLNTKLLALAITLVLWFAVAGQKTPLTTRIAGVQLNFLLAEGMEIGNELPARIDVTRTGTRDQLDLIDTIVTAEIELGECSTERGLNDSRVGLERGGDVRPRTATVTVAGPAGAVAQLRAEEFTVVVDASGNNPRLELPAAMQKKIN